VLEEDTPELLADAVLVVAVLEAVFDELVDPVVVELEVPVEVLLLVLLLLLVVVVKVAETVELVPDASETSKLGDCARMPVFCCSLEMMLIW
jgi:uncharacterized membrane protein YvlD (DUF360 family)